MNTTTIEIRMIAVPHIYNKAYLFFVCTCDKAKDIISKTISENPEFEKLVSPVLEMPMKSDEEPICRVTIDVSIVIKFLESIDKNYSVKIVRF